MMDSQVPMLRSSVLRFCSVLGDCWVLWEQLSETFGFIPLGPKLLHN